MTPKAQPQIALDEEILDDSELERALEDREVAKGKASEARRKFATLDEVVRDLIEDRGIEQERPVRVGRFRINLIPVAGREVEFSTHPTERLKITPDETG